MSKIDQSTDSTKDVRWGRGDSDPKTFLIKSSLGVVQDISSWTFKLTVNSERDPTDQVNEQFSLTGVFVTDGTDGLIAFTPTFSNTDITPGKLFYDIERRIGGVSIKTLIKAACFIVQDLTKV